MLIMEREKCKFIACNDILVTTAQDWERMLIKEESNLKRNVPKVTRASMEHGEKNAKFQIGQ